MTIKELLPDAQYEGIVFYLSEQGFSSPLDLNDFDFDELYFVPGVSDDAIEQCKEILSRYMETASQDDNTPPNGVIDEEKEDVSTAESIEEIQPNSDELLTALSKAANLISVAADTIKTRERLKLFQRAFLDNPEYCVRFDYSLFSSLCSEIGDLIPASDEEERSSDSYSPEEIERLSSVPVSTVFGSLSRRGAMINYCAEHGIKNLLDLENIDFDAIRIKGLGPDSLDNCRKAFLAKRDAVLAGEMSVPEPEKTPQQWLAEMLAELKERNLDCLIARAQGQTLREIGEKYSLTRERARQIINKTIRRLQGPCVAIIKQLIADQNNVSTFDIKALINDQTQVDVVTFVLKNASSVTFFPFADKYVLSEAIPYDYNERMERIAQEIIGDSINYYDNLEMIDEQLSSAGLSFIDSIDYLGYLLEYGYKALGDYVVKKSQGYRNICLYIIRRYFPNGIKLDSDEANADMAKLRAIVRKEFGEGGLPENNRPLTARVSPALILCGRGRYISPENAAIDLPLIEQIVDYINSSKETSFYYAELFDVFSGRLLAQTDIDNYNYLHGVLKTLYPEEFNYERDLLVKKGMARIPFESQLSQLLKSSRRAMTRSEIQGKMPGVSDIRIVNALVRLPEIIQWDYNEFNHIANIDVSGQEVRMLDKLLSDLTEKQSGYCSENQLFAAAKRTMLQFIRKNQIKNSHNLFYIANYFLKNKYRFSRPHIASCKLPNIELTNANIVRFFIGHAKTITYPKLVEMSQQMGWANSAFTAVLNAVEKDYVRISLDEYILREDFQISTDALNRIKMVLAGLTAASGYYGLLAIFSYDSFPLLRCDWNEFLLQTILEEYDLGFKILEPNTKDRRYKKGIIVPNTCPCSSFEELVIQQLKKDHIQTIPEDEFSSYLRRKGLVLTATVPLELYDGDRIRLENGVFIYE